MTTELARCLVIAGVFPPAGGGGALRLVKLLKHLPRFGWQPRVIAPRGRSGWFADPELVAELGDIEVTRVGLPLERRLLEGVRGRAKDPTRKSRADELLRAATGAGRWMRDRLMIPDEHLAWATVAALRASAILREEEFDLLMTASFPYSSHLAGWWLRRSWGLPWLADFADPWAGHPFRGQRDGLRSRIDRLLEERVLRAADGVAVVSPGMKQLMVERCPSVAGKVEVLRNTYDEEEFAGPVVVRDHDRFELLFVGTFDHRVSPPQPIIGALTRLLGARPELASGLVLRVLGGADLESSRYIRETLHTAGLADVVTFTGYASHDRAVRAMRAADALAISVAPGAFWHLTAKVFEYLASGTPILAAVPAGDCRDLLDQCGGAALFEPDDVAGLAGALSEAVSTGRLPVSSPRDATRIRGLAAPEVARQAAALFERLARSGGRSLNRY